MQRRSRLESVLCFVLIGAGTFAAYRRTFSVPLLLDDDGAIGDNVSIRHLWPIARVLSPPHGAGVVGRPLLNLSFALNYAAGGTQLAGYHLLNLAIHVVGAWTLFLLVRHTLRLPVLAERFGSAATWLALCVSVLWAWHPVQTESVTYLSQRAESMAGLCYLLTLYAFARGAAAEGGIGRSLLYSASVLACFAGAEIKETIVTAPLVALLYDRTFVAGRFGDAFKKHGAVFAALAASWLVILHHLFVADRVAVGYGSGVGFDQGVAWWRYGLMECRVVIRYLALAVWPSPLIFDHGERMPWKPTEVWPDAVALAVLLAVTWTYVRRRPLVGFAPAWFLLILAPSSSIVPVAGQPMAENRLYLPLAAIAALAVLALYRFAGRRSLPVGFGVALVLLAASFQRNKAYGSELGIWEDTVAKAPENGRAQVNFANALMKAGRLGEAIGHYQEAIRLDPRDFVARNDFAFALYSEGRPQEAISQLLESLRVNPDFAVTHYDLGNALAGIPGRQGEAIGQFKEAIRLQPDYVLAHNDLGILLAGVPGRSAEAVAEYEEALRLDPGCLQAHFNLAISLLNQPRRLVEARQHIQAVLAAQPENESAHRVLEAIDRAQAPEVVGVQR